MPLTRQQKVELAVDYQGILEKSSGFIVFDYRGLTVAQISALRGKVRETGAQMHVIKNRMLKRAVESKPYAQKIGPFLTGPSAVIFSGKDDPITPAKALVEFAKTNDKVNIKAGVVGEDFMDAKGVDRLSKIPGKNELYSMILGGINAPARNLLGCFNGLGRKLHGLMTAYAEKLEKEAA
ncbi:MAG: 50S ribosomal protein L10 [bacterium]|jgi:large subunit ribosomal protein L10|nr:50S ribosomal protein L10 [bacterium]